MAIAVTPYEDILALLSRHTAGQSGTPTSAALTKRRLLLEASILKRATSLIQNLRDYEKQLPEEQRHLIVGENPDVSAAMEYYEEFGLEVLHAVELITQYNWIDQDLR